MAFFYAGGCSFFQWLLGRFCARDQLDRALEMVWRKMGVSGRHLNRLVLHQFLNCFERDSSHDQAAGEGVLEAMPTEISDLGLDKRLLKPSPDGFLDERLSIIGEEDPLRVTGNLKLPIKCASTTEFMGITLPEPFLVFSS